MNMMTNSFWFERCLLNNTSVPIYMIKYLALQEMSSTISFPARYYAISYSLSVARRKAVLIPA